MAGAGEDILDAGQRRYEQEDSMFSYRNCNIVEMGGEVIGMLVSFSIVTDPDYVEPDPVLAPYSALAEPDSFYVCAMAVTEPFRGLGIGGDLLDLAEDRAREHGLTKLSLIIFEANAGAKRLYERRGYLARLRRPVVPHRLIKHDGDALLMVRHLKEKAE